MRIRARIRYIYLLMIEKKTVGGFFLHHFRVDQYQKLRAKQTKENIHRPYGTNFQTHKMLRHVAKGMKIG